VELELHLGRGIARVVPPVQELRAFCTGRREDRVPPGRRERRDLGWSKMGENTATVGVLAVPSAACVFGQRVKDPAGARCRG